MSLISSKRRLVYRARLFDNERLVGGALVVIFVRKAEETVAQFDARQSSTSVSDKPLC